MIPEEIKKFLWSYDIQSMDIEADKKIVIFNILNYGDFASMKWLFRTYTKEDIIHNANDFPETSWNKKSLNLWKVILGIKPKKRRLS
jgi:hypothetical protein